MADPETRTGRETRLLALVIIVAVVVLFVLARIRFPGANVDLSTVTPAGLERLAARANYDDLAAAVRTAIQTVEPFVVSIDLTPPASQDHLSATLVPQRLAAAIRLKGDVAIAAMPAGHKPPATTDRTALGTTTTGHTVDLKRELIIATLAPQEGQAKLATSAGGFAGFTYVAVVEMTPQGLTAKPVFIGRVDARDDERWGSQLLVAGGADDLPVGSLIFLFDGRFVGLIVAMPGGGRAIAPGAALTTALEAMNAANTGGSK